MLLHIGTKESRAGRPEAFTLPIELVTSTQAILAKRRVGKSYTASVQAEEMLTAKQQIVAIDPTGAWWGLRASADGLGKGFPIALLGGEHEPDAPLDENAGEVIASAIVAERFSAILDLSLFRKGQANRFMAAFLETLYRLNRSAVHLFVDEADTVAPQKPYGDEARVLGAMQDVVRRGGIRGIGCTLITQRPAVLNKDVLTQCEVLTTLRLVHPADINAINAWVSVHGAPEQAARMIESLPSLPVGRAWVWAPDMPGKGEVFDMVDIRERRTFNSGATPKPGASVKPPKVLAKPDVERLGKVIAETARKAREENPEALKKRIRELENQTPSVDPASVNRAVEATRADCQAQFADLVIRLKTELKDLPSRIESVLNDVRLAWTVLEGAQVLRTTTPLPAAASIGTVRTRVAAEVREGLQDLKEKTDLSSGERSILEIVIQHRPRQLTAAQVGQLAAFTPSTVRTYLPKLVSKGLVSREGKELIPTAAGIALLGAGVPQMPTTAKGRQEMWLSKFGQGPQAILKTLIAQYPDSLTNEELWAATGLTASTVRTYVPLLRRAGVVEKDRLRASDELCRD
jgi:hypothetical protein